MRALCTHGPRDPPRAPPGPRERRECGSGGGDGGSERRQRTHLGVLLAEQLVGYELAHGPTPAQARPICVVRIMSSSGCTPWLVTM